AYDLSQGENKLDHVEAYIELKTFYRIQKSITGILDSYLKEREKLEALRFYKPICGHCRRFMKYHIDKSKNISFYTCSHKHTKNMMMAEDLEKIIQQVIDKVIYHLDSKMLLNHTVLRFRELKKEIELDIKAIQHQEYEVSE